jgi:hypothetical protein
MFIVFWKKLNLFIERMLTLKCHEKSKINQKEDQIGPL